MHAGPGASTCTNVQVTCKHTCGVPLFMLQQRKNVSETKRGKRTVKCGGAASGIPPGFDRTNKSSQ